MLERTSDDHGRADPAQSLMREVGAQLRQRRLARGEDLDDVAKSLRIKAAYLFGIEQGDLSALPGRPYALGFLRSYADYLGFDGEDLVGAIKASVADLTDRTRLRIRMPLPENRLPRAPVVVISLAVVVGIYTGWSYTHESSRGAVETVAEVPAELRERALEAASRDADAARDVVSDDAAPSAGTSPVPGAGETNAAEANAAPLTPEAGLAGELALGEDPARLTVQPAAGGDPTGSEAATAAEGASAAGGVEDADGVRTALEVLALLDPDAGGPQGPQVYGRDNANARVILRARETAWIQVSSQGGDYAFTRTLQPGEALLVPNRPDVELWTGNAAGLEVIVDGVVVPALTGGGLVRRHVSLDPDRLLAAAAARP